MKVLGIIPSRYASTRFPGKPLADICGKSMVQRVYEQVVATENVDRAVVATDDGRILRHVEGFGGEAMLTDEQHTNGTSRCNEVMEKLEKGGQVFDVVINIQGDEPMIQPEQIGQLLSLFQDKATDIATLARPIKQREELMSPNMVKVVTDLQGKALYFSRQAIPFVRGEKQEGWLTKAAFLGHIGIYAYRSTVLKKIVRLPEGLLEKAEKLEQLRWLENGLVIKVGLTDYEGIGIDTPENLTKLINKICNGQPR